jgi:hypothetical protein
MRIRSFTVVALSAVVLVASGACVPAPQTSPVDPLDQSLASDGAETQLRQTCGASLIRAQTFTAGRSGSFDKVSLYASGTGALRIELRTVDGTGRPTSIVLRSWTYAGPFAPGAPTDMPLPLPTTVVAGVQYAIVFYATDTCTGWVDVRRNKDVNSTYSGGHWWSTSTASLYSEFFAYPDYDIPFRTFVS